MPDPAADCASMRGWVRCWGFPAVATPSLGRSAGHTRVPHSPAGIAPVVQFLPSNSMGSVMGPVMPVRGFQGAGPLRRGWGMHWVITVRAWASRPGKVHAESP